MGYSISFFAEATAKEALENVMAEALSKAGSNRSAVKSVCLSLSGVNHPSDQQRILGWLRYRISFRTYSFQFNSFYMRFEHSTFFSELYYM